MMRGHIKFWVLFLFIASCIEPYEFVVKDNNPILVVEGYIADKSFNESLLYPSDGRYFTVKLSVTDDVINTRAKPVPGATVRLLSDQDEEWLYIESEPGVYTLVENDFKANNGMTYKLIISVSGALGENTTYESAWETLPDIVAPTMGEVSFTETSMKIQTIELDKKIIKTISGIRTNIMLAENNTNESIFYRWKFLPMWIYQAPFSSVSDPGHKCWVTDQNYLKDYTLQIDKVGGYKKDLFFLQTLRNERIFEELSILVIQHNLTEKYYSFWREMQEQTQRGVIVDAPPYNLQTNIHCVSGDEKVVGFFGVVSEQTKRWYFNKEDLSYFVQNTLRDDCSVPFQDVAPECFNCLQYSFGRATTEKPFWWR